MSTLCGLFGSEHRPAFVSKVIRRWLIVVLCVMVGSCGGRLPGRRSAVVGRHESDISMVGVCSEPAAGAFQVVAAAYAAYNAGEGELWIDAQLTGEFHPTTDERARSHAEKLRIFEAASCAGSRIEVLRCFSLGFGEWPGLTEEGVPVPAGHRFCCDTVTSDVFHAESGRDRLNSHRWVVEGGEVIAFLAAPPPTVWTDFATEFRAWLDAEHPEVGDAFTLDPGGTLQPARCVPAALRLVGAFVDASSRWPEADPEPGPTSVLSQTTDGIEVSITDRSQIDLVNWALRRFEHAGLAPPPVVRVDFEPPAVLRRSQTCFPGAPAGTATVGTDGGIITLRLPDDYADAPAEFSVEARHVALHEFAHVWNAAYLDGPTRQELLARRGFEVWTGPCLMNDTGNECAAEVLAWGLMDELVRPRVPLATCEGLARLFELLTGVPPVDRLVDCRDETMQDASTRVPGTRVASPSQ